MNVEKLKELKNLVAASMKSIIEIDVQKTIELIETWYDNEKNKHEHTEWHNIVCFHKNADFASQYLDKGQLIYIEGSIRSRVWTNTQKEQKKIVEVIANQITLLNSTN